MENLVHLARLFASAAHKAVGQKRKYTEECYCVHPEAVARKVKYYGGTDEMVAAAWLHDVVEDTEVKITDIYDFFGNTVGDLVSWLTEVSVPEDGNRAERKAKDREYLAKAPAEAQTIKYCDLLDNTNSITEYDKGFAKVYLKEKELLLEVMTKGDPRLLWQAINLTSFEQGKLK